MILMYDFCKMNNCPHLKRATLYFSKIQCYKCEITTLNIHNDDGFNSSLVNYYYMHAGTSSIYSGDLKKCINFDLFKQTLAVEKL